MFSWEIILALIPGLILFLYGLEHFSKEILNVAGDKFREILTSLTKNRFRGLAFGALLTSVIQSSSATTSITVGLVNAGAISFVSSLGIILGANIGTTITAQLVALEFTVIAPLFIILGFLLNFGWKRLRFLAKPVFYFGLVFFGLHLVGQAIAPLESNIEVFEFFGSISSIPIGIFIGFITTVIFQSSSVVTGIAVILASSGIISLDIGIPIILGTNLGTTSKSILASIGTNLFAKRTAVAHALFNVVGILLILPFIGPFTEFVRSFGGDSARQLANAHTIFNVGIGLVFLVGLNPFRKLIEYVVRGEEEEILFRTKYLNALIPSGNKVAFGLIEKELRYSLQVTRNLFDESMKMLKYPSKQVFMKTDKLESLSDYLDEKIESALLDISKRDLDNTEGKKIILLVRISNSIEQFSDIADDIALLVKKITDRGISLSPESTLAAYELYEELKESMDNIIDRFPNVDLKKLSKVLRKERGVESLITSKYNEHLKRLKTSKLYAGSLFVESVSIMESALLKLQEISSLGWEYCKVIDKK